MTCIDRMTDADRADPEAWWKRCIAESERAVRLAVAAGIDPDIGVLCPNCKETMLKWDIVDRGGIFMCCDTIGCPAIHHSRLFSNKDIAKKWTLAKEYKAS